MPVTDLRALRQQRGRGAPTEVALSDRLTVRVRVTDLDTLIALGKIPNPLVPAALELRKGERGELLSAADVTLRLEMLDSLAAALVVDPPWAALDEVSAADGLAPEGKLCIADLLPHEIGALWYLAFQGLEFWETFRVEQQRLALAAAGGGGGPDAEQLPDAAGAGPAAAAPAPDRGAAGPSPVSADVGAGPPAAGGGEPAASGPPADVGDSDGGTHVPDADGPGLRPDGADLIQFPVLGYAPEARTG